MAELDDIKSCCVNITRLFCGFVELYCFSVFYFNSYIDFT